MATHDYVIANGTGAAVRSDLNGAFAAIVSQNSSATEPSPSYAYQRWADTTAGVMKMRNGANNAWITLYQLDGEWSTIAFENGTAAAPSIYFKDSGTDTGIYSPGADQVGISTGGTARITVDGSGNVNIDSNTVYVDAANNRVGIGTASPGNTFHVENSAAFDAQILAKQTASTNGVCAIRAQSNSAIVELMAGGSSYGTNYMDQDEAGLITQTAGDSMRFNIGGSYCRWTFGSSEKARLDSSGRLLVGVSANTNGGILQLSGGITFPATAVAASDPNTLDDYEEGTWTPTDASGASLSLTAASGVYTRIGRLVTCQAEFTYPTTTNVSAAIIGGLPFTASALGGGFSMYTTIAIGSIALRNATNTSTIILTYGSNQDTGLANIDMSAAVSQITFTYQVGA